MDQRPVNLSEADLPKVNHAGIDAVWQHGQSYTVTEAKARESIAAAYRLGKFLTGKGAILKVSGLNPSQELLHYLLSDSSDKRGVEFRMVQMSREWVADRAEGEKVGLSATAALQSKRCARRVLLITFESEGALDHAQALTELYTSKKSAAELHPTLRTALRENGQPWILMPWLAQETPLASKSKTHKERLQASQQR